MKQYMQPKIKLIELDPRQAILQVCQIGGVFVADFGISSFYCIGFDGTLGSTTNCTLTFKGGNGPTTSGPDGSSSGIVS